MHSFIEHINRQLKSSEGKNLFHSNRKDLFTFIPETEDLITMLSELDPETEDILLDYITGRALEVFCNMNQYYSFSTEVRSELKKIYKELSDAFKTGEDLEKVSEKHYLNLKNWLQSSNPFSEKVYEKAGTIPAVIPCAEYSPELQLELLKIDCTCIEQPVLDVGCGKNASLVSYLQEKGIEAYGIDRFVNEIRNCKQSDWFEFDFKKDYWGTIISNLGFSNHFVHQHLREDGNYISYARKYVEILQSLKQKGSFYYAPGLPFIETYLNSREYEIQSHKIGKTEYSGTRVTRLV